MIVDIFDGPVRLSAVKRFLKHHRQDKIPIKTKSQPNFAQLLRPFSLCIISYIFTLKYGYTDMKLRNYRHDE